MIITTLIQFHCSNDDEGVGGIANKVQLTRRWSWTTSSIFCTQLNAEKLAQCKQWSQSHTDTQHRQCTGTFTPSGGKSDRQRGESGLSKPQRSVGGCRNETKKTTATASHIKVALLSKAPENRDQISSCKCDQWVFEENYEESISSTQQWLMQKSFVIKVCQMYQLIK